MKQPSKARRRITLLWFPRLTRVVPVQFKIPGTIARRWKLLESSLYWLINKDHTDRLRRKLTEKLLNLKPVYNKMRPKHIQPPRIYGLPETHKSNILLRPIVSYVNTFAWFISLFSWHLSSLNGKSDYTVKNSADFVSTRNKEKVDENEIMVSFDVESLFTNVAIESALRATLWKLESDLSFPNHTTLTAAQIDDLLNFVLRSTYFQ